MNQISDNNATRQVLIVDDDTTIRFLARETLEEAGFLVTEAANGAQGLAAFESNHPQVILLDVMMPEIDGFAVCKKIRNHPDGKNIAILMMTGLEDIDSIQRAYDVGATDFITKPINWQILGYRANYMYRANQAFKDLKNSEVQLSSAQKIAHLGSWNWDIANNRFQLSDELYRILNIDSTTCALTYETFINFIHPIDKEQVKMTIEEAVATQQPFHLDYKIVIADGLERFVSIEGQPVLNSKSEVVRMAGTIQDITERKQAEAQIRSLALYDNLTGLPNRILFRDRLEQAIRQASRQNSMVAAIFIDLDRFKDINDSLGHNAGDELLRQVANRLLSVTRSSDTVSRLGGDEFTIVLQNLTSLDVICSLAQKILDTFSEPFLLEAKEIFVTSSIGVAVYPSDAEKADDLLKNADIAMYYAKDNGKNNYKLFSSDMQVKADTRLTMQNEMRQAMERNEFFLNYQPKFDTKTGELTGMEALIRWKHPEKEVIMPNTFIPIAEATGLIVPLGEWVLKEACRQNMAWQAMGHEPIKIAVNVSAIQFKRSNFLATVNKVLKKTGMAAHFLQIEITETSLMQQSENTESIRSKDQPASIATVFEAGTEGNNSIINTLDILQKMGVSIAIDDFGTGYSSLSYLRYFPIDVIKIDSSFVWAINAWQGSEIISTIIDMSKKLHLQVTAEGVETEHQKTYLINRGCHELQGFLTGKPALAEDCVKYFVKPQKKVVNE
ncbi:MAG: EAL domain-containing protein [Proteobacteria bacterium]|nr:EAL domain-containing protein [Pseudomonadota bacterium]